LPWQNVPHFGDRSKRDFGGHGGGRFGHDRLVFLQGWLV
jgi:hypothetical protein